MPKLFFLRLYDLAMLLVVLADRSNVVHQLSLLVCVRCGHTLQVHFHALTHRPPASLEVSLVFCTLLLIVSLEIGRLLLVLFFKVNSLLVVRRLKLSLEFVEVVFELIPYLGPFLLPPISVLVPPCCVDVSQFLDELQMGVFEVF